MKFRWNIFEHGDPYPLAEILAYSADDALRLAVDFGFIPHPFGYFAQRI